MYSCLQHSHVCSFHGTFFYFIPGKTMTVYHVQNLSKSAPVLYDIIYYATFLAEMLVMNYTVRRP